ncbi:MAG: hypothetical protein KAI63_02425, partial [Planctomycetes bacterium]|nr:hypothetical protein [Planctomycetota bacterium]
LPVKYLAVEMLGQAGEKYIPLLLNIARNKSGEMQLRLAALQNIRFTKKYIKDLKKIVTTKETPPILKAYGLYQLYRLGDGKIVTLSKSLIRQALENMTKPKAALRGDGFEAVVAMRILGTIKANKETNLKKIIMQAYRQQKKKTKVPSKKPDKEIIVLASLPPVLETAILQLGKMGSKEAMKQLLKLSKIKEFPRRAEVAMALSRVAARDKTAVVEALLGLLSDEEGWTRYCAYWSLHKITQKDFNCEWVFDPAAKRKKVVEEWSKWWAKEKAALEQE